MNDIHGATGAYVVHALTLQELTDFEAHLAVCAACRIEVSEFGETVPKLSLVAAAPAPPSALREAILSGLAGVRQLPPLPERGLARVDDLARRRSSRRARVLPLLVAAVTVLALALGGMAYSLARPGQAPVAGPSADTSLLAAPDARILPLVLANGAHVSFVVSTSQNRALFVGGDLPSPGIGKTYQLWTRSGGTVSPDNLVGAGTNVTSWLHGPISSSSALAVSIESAGGAQHPSVIEGVVTL
jgi:Anti-sigma-K factor rskA